MPSMGGYWSDFDVELGAVYRPAGVGQGRGRGITKPRLRRGRRRK